MAVDTFANNVVTTLNGTITSSQTSLVVTSATGFSAASTGVLQFRIAIDTELMVVTNKSGTTFTVVRGAEGSTAASHTSGATVSEVLTAAGVQTVQYPGATPVLLADSAGSLFYSTGTQLADDTGALYYGSGIAESDSLGNLYYGSGAIESDAIGQLYYGNGNLFTDNLEQIYYGQSTGALFVDTEGNIYAMNGNIVIDFNGNIYYAPGAPVFSSGFTGANPFLIYPNAGVGSALADANGNLYYGNGTFPTPGSVLADANGLLYPGSFSSAPSYVEGALYYDTTLNKLRVGGASGWETVTSV